MGGKTINGVSVKARLMIQKINQVGFRRVLLACAGRPKMDIERDAALLRSVAKHGYTGAAKLHGVSKQRAEQVTKEFYRCALLVEKGVSLTTLDEIRLDIKKVSVMVAERQMSWGDLAKNSGISGARLSQIKKHGRCRTTTIGKIANALGVAVEDLIVK